jgi:outer membrane receptor protein involved in Fe transport
MPAVCSHAAGRLGHSWLVASCLLVVLLASPAAHAQVAVLEVAVSTAAGTPAAGELVELSNPGTGFRAEATTGERGRVRFTAVPAGAGYSIAAGGQPLATAIRLRANESRAIAVTLPAGEVTVTARRAANVINASNAEVSAGLDAAELRLLPVESRDLSRTLLRLPNVAPATGFFPEAPVVSINGANGLYTQYLIDGLDNNENFLGGPKFPISTGFVQDVTVLAASYSVEYGRTGNGVVNVTSKRGTNDWQGEAFYLMRPGQPLDSESPFPQRDLTGNALKDGFERHQYGVGFGGPLVADRTFIYANLEVVQDDKDNILASEPLEVATTVPGSNDQLLASVRLDQVLTDRWRLAARLNYGEQETEQQGGGLDGGVTFPSAGSRKDRQSLLSTVSAVYDGGGYTSETRVGYYRFDWNYGDPLGGPGAQLALRSPDDLPAAILGNPGFVFDSREETWQLQQKFTVERGRHALAFGLDVLRADFRLNGGGNPDGNFAVRLTQPELDAVVALGRGAALTVADVAGVAPNAATVPGSFGIELRPAAFGEDQLLAALYLEDQVQLTDRMTVTAGLRYDYDTATEAGTSSVDSNNLAPRVAFNFLATDDVALRGGLGLFYEKIPYAIVSDAIQQNTTSAAFRDQVEQLVAKGLLPAGTDLGRVTTDGNLVVTDACATLSECLAVQADPALRDQTFANERRLKNPDGLDNPYTLQLSFGPQWQVTTEVVFTADVIYAWGYNQLRLRDANAADPFTPNLAALTPANIDALRAIADPAARAAQAEVLGLVRSQAAADATRPVAPVPGGARKIIVSETDGESRYWAVNLRLDKDPGVDIWGYALSYTLSELRNNTDDINFQASNPNDFDAEWGPSVNDRRHIISAIGYLVPRDDLSLSIAGLFQSGQPVNFIPDAGIFGTTDLNGDGASFSDAYLGNSDRAPGQARNAGRLDWSKQVDLGLRYAPRIGGLSTEARLEFSADVFNVFDWENESGFANSATQSNQIQVAGQPFVRRNAGPPRQFQFGVRYFF